LRPRRPTTRCSACRPQYQALYKRLDEIPREELNRRQHAADLSFLHQGITDATMNHGEGWQFIQVGRYIERALSTSTLLDVYTNELMTPSDEDVLQRNYLDWVGLLKACTAFEAYCKGYVSGYLFHRVEYNDRSAQDATHAWIEALLPESGWIGFDPTNNLLAGQRHIRVAVGRDYSDVPPTRGVFKRAAESELSVAVQVKPAEEPDSEEALRLIATAVMPETDVWTPSA